MKIVFLGAPGSGKGTQATKISEKYNIPHISTGEIFREHIKDKTPLGILAKSYIDKGQLCPDEVTNEIVKERINRQDCINGYLLDGYPRTISQAVELDKFTSLDAVIDLDIEISSIVHRLTGRRSCLNCGGTYHVDFIGNVKECPKCGADLVIREDDDIETVQKRMDVYVMQTEPLIEYYKSKKILRLVDGAGDIEKIHLRIVEVLESL